jgi:hypothetical protein
MHSPARSTAARVFPVGELRCHASIDVAAIDDKVTGLTELLNRHGIDTSAVLAPAGISRAEEERA